MGSRNNLVFFSGIATGVEKKISQLPGLKANWRLTSVRKVFKNSNLIVVEFSGIFQSAAATSRDRL